jgi:hypothetical protein
MFAARKGSMRPSIKPEKSCHRVTIDTVPLYPLLLEKFPTHVEEIKKSDKEDFLKLCTHLAITLAHTEGHVEDAAKFAPNINLDEVIPGFMEYLYNTGIPNKKTGEFAVGEYSTFKIWTQTVHLLRNTLNTIREMILYNSLTVGTAMFEYRGIVNVRRVLGDDYSNFIVAQKENVKSIEPIFHTIHKGASILKGEQNKSRKSWVAFNPNHYLYDYFSNSINSVIETQNKITPTLEVTEENLNPRERQYEGLAMELSGTALIMATKRGLNNEYDLKAAAPMGMLAILNENVANLSLEDFVSIHGISRFQAKSQMKFAKKMSLDGADRIQEIRILASQIDIPVEETKTFFNKILNVDNYKKRKVTLTKFSHTVEQVLKSDGLYDRVDTGGEIGQKFIRLAEDFLHARNLVQNTILRANNCEIEKNGSGHGDIKFYVTLNGKQEYITIQWQHNKNILDSEKTRVICGNDWENVLHTDKDLPKTAYFTQAWYKLTTLMESIVCESVMTKCRKSGIDCERLHDAVFVNKKINVQEILKDFDENILKYIHFSHTDVVKKRITSTEKYYELVSDHRNMPLWTIRMTPGRLNKKEILAKKILENRHQRQIISDTWRAGVVAN